VSRLACRIPCGDSHQALHFISHSLPAHHFGLTLSKRTHGGAHRRILTGSHFQDRTGKGLPRRSLPPPRFQRQQPASFARDPLVKPCFITFR